jgi:hypothetical protein
MDAKMSSQRDLSKFMRKATEVMDEHHPNWRKYLTSDQRSETL